MNCGKSYIDEYGEAQGCGDFASQCPACLRAERDQLRAEVERLKAAPVVVPELTDVIEMLESSEKWEDHGESLREPLEKLRAISRLRTIGPGEVVVDAAELAGLREFADGWSSFRDQFNDIPYHYQGMGCGIEDRGIHDRYAACEYGWECAMERVAERFPEIDTLDALRSQKEGGAT